MYFFCRAQLFLTTVLILFDEKTLVPLVAEAREGTYAIQPETAICLALCNSGAYKLFCWLDPMSLNIEKKAREPRPHHV